MPKKNAAHQDPPFKGVTVSPEALQFIKRRAVRSARTCIETLCESEPTHAPAASRVWDTQRLQKRPMDSELFVYELLDLHDAVQCLDLLGLLRYPFPDRPHVIEFREDIEHYELIADMRVLFKHGVH